MPLPFAPKPDESRVYDSLKDKLLTEITADNFDSLRSTVYAQGVDGAEDEYRRLLLLGLAADQLSVSGPIANTQFVTQTSATSAGDAVLFTPGAGEVWQLAAASVGTLSSGTTKVMLLLNDTNTTSSTLLEAVTAAAAAFDLGEPIYVGYPCRLIGNLTGYSSGTTTIRISCVRVR